MSVPKPEWIDDYGEVVRLAHWLVTFEDWDDMDNGEKLAELLNFLTKPWNYDTEYKLMTFAMYRCADCGCNVDAFSDDEREDAEAGHKQWCGDCHETRAAEAKGEAAEAEHELRADMDGDS